MPSPSFAAGEIRRAPVPEWVDTLPIPEPRPERQRQVENGVYYLLSDAQMMPNGAQENYFYRVVHQVTGREGLEQAGRLDIGFDPAYEDLILHHIRILRDGVEIDGLTEARIEELRREPDLDGGIIDGRRTAHIELTDLRVGDIVDAAYSWDRTHLVWPGHFFSGVPINWSAPLEMSRYRFHWPSGQPLTLSNIGTNIVPS